MCKITVQRKNQSPGVEFQEACLCHQQAWWPSWALVSYFACTTRAPLVGSCTRLPSVFPNNCEEPKYHGIIDGKMETPPQKRKNIKKAPIFSFISLLLSSVKTQQLRPSFWHFCFWGWSLLVDNHFDRNSLHVGLLPVSLIRLDSGEQGLFCSILYSQNSELHMVGT